MLKGIEKVINQGSQILNALDYEKSNHVIKFPRISVNYKPSNISGDLMEFSNQT